MRRGTSHAYGWLDYTELVLLKPERSKLFKTLEKDLQMAQWITVLVDQSGNLSSGLKEKRDYNKLCVYIRAHQRHDKPQVSHPEVVTAAAVEFEWSEEESQAGARKNPVSTA